MNGDITQRKTPEERELEKKRAELTALETVLAQMELDLATIQAQLHSVERRYLNIVGTLYAELDEIEAQIAETRARLNPNNQVLRERAKHTRAEAQESAQATGNAHESKGPIKFKPSEEIKRLYREVAKHIHPDLTTDGKEQIMRHQLMAEANRAYERGDTERLQAILREWETSPETIKGEGPGAELVRVIRKIAQVEERLSSIENETKTLKESDLYQLWAKADEAEANDRDLLEDMAAQVKNRIADARKRLESLQGNQSP
jgi:hypothetical protein